MKFENFVNKEKFSIGREIIISIIVASLVGGLISFYFSKKIDERTSSREFIYNYSRTFFDNPKYRNVSVALEDQYLYNKPFVDTEGKEFSEYDVDDYYSLVYDIWSFYKDGFISKKLLNEQYTYYLCITTKAPETIAYRKELSDENFVDNYNFFDDMQSTLGFKDKNCKDLK